MCVRVSENENVWETEQWIDNERDRETERQREREREKVRV